MRNETLETLDVLTGSWTTTMTDAWFLDSLDDEVPGTAEIGWLGDSFLEFRWRNDEADVVPSNETVMVIGRSDARDVFEALYHDARGVCRIFAMTFDGSRWTLERADPDMHQRFVAEVGDGRIVGRWDASDDEGATWRTDFVLVLDRP